MAFSTIGWSVSRNISHESVSGLCQTQNHTSQTCTLESSYNFSRVQAHFQRNSRIKAARAVPENFVRATIISLIL